MFRPVKVRQHLALMQARGYPAEAVLEGSGITTEQLGDPLCLMDLAQLKRIVANMLRLTGEPSIGLDFGEKTELADLGMLGFLVMSAQTTRQTALYWINYSHELLGIPFRLELHEHPSGEWSLDLYDLVPLGDIRRFCIEEQLMMICKLAGKLGAATSTIKLVELAYGPPTYRELYEQYFEAPVKFDAPKTRVTIVSPRLDDPLLGNDKEFHEICARQCELMARKIHNTDSMVSKTKHALMRLGGQSPGIENIARELNMSPRTLSRHLLKENYSYHQLVDEFRSELALEYLNAGVRSPKEIGYLLGFQHTPSFHRAFKRWTGGSVSDYLASKGK